MIKRKKFDKIPLQGNYYPLPAAGYIEDINLRFTILSGQPLGGSSLGSGEFEVESWGTLNPKIVVIMMNDFPVDYNGQAAVPG